MDKIILDTDKVIKKIGEGKESDIYLYQKENQNVVLKIFRRKIFLKKELRKQVIEVTDKDLDRKREKLTLLDKDPCMLDEVKLYDLVYDENDKFIGYTMEDLNLPSLYDYLSKSKKTKLELLRNLKRKVEDLNNNGVYIGDFASYDNFLVTKDKEIKLIDVDNFSVHGLDFDLLTGYTDDYLYHKRDIKNVDNFSFNFFTLAFYKGQFMSSMAADARKNGLPYRFDTEENRELLDDLLSNKDYQKRYFLDYRKKGLFK